MIGHTVIDSIMSYIGAAIQGQIIQLLSSGELSLLPEIMFLICFIIALGIAAASADLMVLLRWAAPAIAIVFLLNWTSPVDVSIMSQGDVSVKSYPDTRSELASYGRAEANHIFLMIVGAIDSVVRATVKAVDRALGGPDYATSPFIFLRAVNGASATYISDPVVRKNYIGLLNACYGPAAEKIQELGIAKGKSKYWDPIQLASAEGLLADIKVPVRAVEGVIVDNCQTYYDKVTEQITNWAYNDPNTSRFYKLLYKLGLSEPEDALINVAMANTAKEYFNTPPGSMGMGGASRPSGWEWMLSPEKSALFIANKGIGWAIRSYQSWRSSVSGNFFLNAAPKIQGYVILIIYVLFPFVALIAMLPGRLSILGHYFGAIFWIKSLTLFWMMIHRISYLLWHIAGTQAGFIMAGQKFNSYVASQMTEVTAYITWVTVVLLMASPLISYALLFGGMAGLLHLQFMPRVPNVMRGLWLARGVPTGGTATST